ncbi:hypothetical protein JIG36_00795 [Actinoplanes sp. LDG1-06]|uniref:Uncharacterized protein n=1 Tax=Paractinoplanes ovalisporus TaxID=2810368 RepID=A0ABS2A4D8_9ACTN|nr:hypothetical protein [Actinoplanes ovalisporus]MBM2614091.1 hypothetical protein [Actinoplanes ovalisporus]
MPQPSRAVLVIPRDGKLHADARLTRALDHIARTGWELVAVIDPQNHVDALRMVLDGLADIVVVTRSEHFPLVCHASA